MFIVLPILQDMVGSAVNVEVLPKFQNMVSKWPIFQDMLGSAVNNVGRAANVLRYGEKGCPCGKYCPCIRITTEVLPKFQGIVESGAFA